MLLGSTYYLGFLLGHTLPSVLTGARPDPFYEHIADLSIGLFLSLILYHSYRVHRQGQ
jgi:hypothetical protein